jgi:hypothetical protein
MFCMFPDSESEWKKGVASQTFIRKEITSYRIGTLDKLKESDFVLKSRVSFVLKTPFWIRIKLMSIFLLFLQLHLRTVGRWKYYVIAPKWDVCDKKNKRKNTKGIGINFVQKLFMGISVYSTIIIKITIIIFSFRNLKKEIYISTAIQRLNIARKEIPYLH